MAMPPGTRRALEEALSAAQSLVDGSFRDNFILVGGYALHLHGRQRGTRDLDIAINAESLNKWQEAAAIDPRFILGNDGQWRYWCEGSGIEGLGVDVEFLDLSLLSRLERVEGAIIGDYRVATLPELAILKAEAMLGRGEPRDGEDLEWILNKMEARGLGFEGITTENIFEDERVSISELRRLISRYHS